MDRIVPVAIALGSNLGDRRRHLERALARLRHLLSDLRVSAFHDTTPVAVPAQPRFLNAVVTGSTTLSAQTLLDRLLTIERDEGRQRPFSGAPRTLDLDLLFYGESILETPGLTIPHPRLRERLFVLRPLAELAPEWVDPVTGSTVRELRNQREAIENAECGTRKAEGGRRNGERGTRNGERGRAPAAAAEPPDGEAAASGGRLRGGPRER